MCGGEQSLRDWQQNWKPTHGNVLQLLQKQQKSLFKSRQHWNRFYKEECALLDMKPVQLAAPVVEPSSTGHSTEPAPCSAVNEPPVNMEPLPSQTSPRQIGADDIQMRENPEPSSCGSQNVPCCGKEKCEYTDDEISSYEVIGKKLEQTEPPKASWNIFDGTTFAVMGKFLLYDTKNDVEAVIESESMKCEHCVKFVLLLTQDIQDL